MSSCISFAFCLEQGRSGVLIVMILDGVEVQNGREVGSELDGVEQKANL
jgi:hypothetical protein